MEIKTIKSRDPREARNEKRADERNSKEPKKHFSHNKRHNTYKSHSGGKRNQRKAR